MGGLFHHRRQLTSTFLVLPVIDFNPNHALDKYSKNLRETAQKINVYHRCSVGKNCIFPLLRILGLNAVKVYFRGKISLF
jgi:hypothetical protein